MCFRSKHGAITAWCATFDNATSSKIPIPNVLRSPDHYSTDSTLSFKPRGLSSSVSFCIYYCIIFCFIVIVYIPSLAAALSSSLTDRRSMVLINNGNSHFPTHISSLIQHPYRRRTKRLIPQQRPERHLWTSDLVTFVCDELTDPCTRAAFLRRHTYHEICSDLPPLYLLPHIDDVIKGSNQSSTLLCNSKDKGVRSTDGLYRTYLENSTRCRQSLETLDAKIRSSLNEDLELFVDVLERSFCILANATNDTMLEECVQCRVCCFHF